MDELHAAGLALGRLSRGCRNRLVRTGTAWDIRQEHVGQNGCVAGLEVYSFGRVEEVAIEAGSIDLVTIGEAFHRLEQGVVLRRIRQWLKAGGCVAIGGCFGVQFGDEQWQASLRRAIEEWEGAAAAPSPGNAAALSRGIARDTGQLIEAGFAGVVNRQFSDSHTWTRDSILGHLHSTSRYSLSALGEGLEGFRNAVLGALRTDESTRFRQDVSCGYSVGWKG